MKTNLPKIGDQAKESNGTVWTVKDIKTGKLHSVDADKCIHGGSITHQKNYHAKLLLVSGNSATWQPLTAWRNLCKYGSFIAPAAKGSRCKGYQVPAYQAAMLALNNQGIYKGAAEKAEKMTGISRTAIYVGPARVDGQLVNGKYTKASK